MRTSDEINAVAAAMAKAQAAMGPAIKGTKNPHFRSTYADLSSVVEAIRGPLTEHGLCWTQAPAVDVQAGLVHVTTRIIHTSGQWVECTLSARPGRSGSSADLSPQAVGSATTYLRRYGLQALCGLATDDDDGEAAQGRQQPRVASRAPAPAPDTYRRPQPPAHVVRGEPEPDGPWDAASRSSYQDALDRYSLTIDQVDAYLTAHNRPNLDTAGKVSRMKLLLWVGQSDGAAKVRAWLESQDAARGEE
jgi:hypothetical protein